MRPPPHIVPVRVRRVRAPRGVSAGAEINRTELARDAPVARFPPTTLTGGAELASVINAQESWRRASIAWESRHCAQSATIARLETRLDQVDTDIAELKKQLMSHERMLSRLTAPIVRELVVRSMVDTFVPGDKPRSLLKAANDLGKANQDPTGLYDKLPSEAKPLYDPHSVAVALRHFDKATRNEVAHLKAEPAQLFKEIICMSGDEAADVHEHYGRCMAWVLGPRKGRTVLGQVERDPLATSKHRDNVCAYRAYIDSAVGPESG